jgi:hypothetical protein
MTNCGFLTRQIGNNNLTTIVDAYGVVKDVQLDNPGQAAVQFGLNANSSHAVAAQLPLHCSSGNCTWPAFESLAVCSKCTNLNSKIQTSSALDYPMAWFFPTQVNPRVGSGPENLTSYFLPNGLNINNRKESYYTSAAPVLLTSKATLKPSETITFQNSTTLLFSTSVLRVSPPNFPRGGTWQSTHVDLSATECGLYLCIKNFNSKVVNGSLIEDSGEIAATRDPESFSVKLDNAGNLSFPDETVSPDVDALYSNVTFFPRTPLVIKLPESSNSSNLSDNQVVIPQAAIDGLSSYIFSIFEEGTFVNATSLSENNKDTGCTFGDSSISCAGPHNISGMVIGDSSLTDDASTDATEFSPTVMKLLFNSNDLNELFNTVAASITNEMRRSADNQTTWSGQLGTVKTVLDVRWAWISFPVFLVLSSLVFFITAIVESHRQAVPLWKSSTLAVLCHGIEKKAGDQLNSIDGVRELEDLASNIKLQLRRGGSKEGELPSSQFPRNLEGNSNPQ